MRLFRFIDRLTMVTVALLVCATVANAQSLSVKITVKGVVTDSNGEPLP